MAETGPQTGERIAKRMARAGLCSRREAERWIADGRVRVDGEVLTTAACVVTDASTITVDGRTVAAPAPARLWRYHKPNGVICTSQDPQGRETVFDHLPKSLPRVMLVGRLDLTSEGLLLLTNDGGVARRIELPATGWRRRYRVRVFGTPDPEALARLATGITIDGIDYGPIEAVLERIQGRNAWLMLTLTEGKYREVRKVLAHLGLTVNRLIRIAFGPFQLGSLPRDAVAEVPAKVLAEQLGSGDGSRKRRPGDKRGKQRHADRRR